MLRRWHKPITIALTPEGVSLNTAGKVTFLPLVKANKSVKASSWAPLLTVLEQHANSIASKHVKLILSNHYVRYAILPWQSDIFSQQDWQSLAENHMRNLYGNVVDGWRVNVLMQGFGKPMVISAVDQFLLVKLENIAKQYSVTVDAVEPALISVLNHYRHKLKNTAWLLIAEPQRLLLAEIVKGVLVRFSAALPPVGHEAIEGHNLVKRAVSLLHNRSPISLYGYGTSKMLSGKTIDNIKLNHLTVANTTSHLPYDAVFSELI